MYPLRSTRKSSPDYKRTKKKEAHPHLLLLNTKIYLIHYNMVEIYSWENLPYLNTILIY